MGALGIYKLRLRKEGGIKSLKLWGSQLTPVGQLLQASYKKGGIIGRSTMGMEPERDR